MNQPSTSPKPEANEIPAEITALIAAIQELPVEHRSHLAPALAQVIESTKRRRRILTLVQDALSQLRVDMKYLVFDLEATRRERDNYRRQVEGT